MADRTGERCFSRETQDKETAWKTSALHSIILKWIFKKCDGGGMDWIGLVEDRDS
jgi:hypothetical protein